MSDSGPFEDERGIIQDLLGPVDSVTRITTVKGAVRGNHVHHSTVQWTLVLSGTLRMASMNEVDRIVGPGQLVRNDPGVAHAWKAIEHSECLVFARGPRGRDYESDTIRLATPLLT